MAYEIKYYLPEPCRIREDRRTFLVSVENGSGFLFSGTQGGVNNMYEDLLRIGVNIAKRYIAGETIKSIKNDLGLRPVDFDHALDAIRYKAKLSYYKRNWRTDEESIENIKIVDRIVNEIEALEEEIEAKKVEMESSVKGKRMWEEDTSED